jgi:predicted  nucleic acid-binding Zn-ribbon protein
MASLELQRLWKLAQIDNRITDIRLRAGALDPGRAIQAELQALAQEDAEIGGNARSLSAEQKDLELLQASLDDKLKRIDKEMYGGKVVSAREVSTLEKEIAAIKRQKDKNDDRLLELMDLVPPAQAAAKKIEAKIADANKRLVERRKKALEEKATLEAEFKRLSTVRPDVAKNVPASLMNRYESAKQRGGGVGMVQISKQETCGGCGTHIPERTVHSLREDKLATCESCHRILYYTEGLV